MARKNEITIKKWLIQNFFSVAAIVVALANLWIAFKLAPLAQDIETIRAGVLANETRVVANETKIEKLEEKVWEELRHIRGRVDHIYTYFIR